MIESYKPIFVLLTSFLAPLFIIFSSNRPNLRESFSILASVLKFLLVLNISFYVFKGHIVYLKLVEIFPNVALEFKIDEIGIIFALVSSFLWIFTTLYSIGYMRGLKEEHQTRYFCFFALAMFSTLGVAFAGNLLTLYMFYELLSLSTYPLVVHHQDEKARISGRKYLIYILGTSIGLVLPAMIICYNLTGTLSFEPSGILNNKVSLFMANVLLLMFVFGFAKSAIMPLHAWLPAAMVAPTPVSALLHAVAVVKVGVFSIIRIFTGIFGIKLLAQLNSTHIITFFAAFTIITASLIAMSQDELKRRLAFSTISQLSYIILGISMLSPKAIAGGILHIIMHAFGKITLFFCAGSIMVGAGKKYISEMDGLGRYMPYTMGLFFLGSLSIIGLPPMGGFISKWYLLLGAVEIKSLVLMAVILLSSFLNCVYFLPIAYNAFFKAPKEDFSYVKENYLCVIPALIAVIGSLVLFFYPDPFLNLIFEFLSKIKG